MCQDFKISYLFHISLYLGNSLPQDICCMAADGRLVFAAYGNVFSAFARNKEVCITELFKLSFAVNSCHKSRRNFIVGILHLGHSGHVFF